jgi:hypothetical protein
MLRITGLLTEIQTEDIPNVKQNNNTHVKVFPVFEYDATKAYRQHVGKVRSSRRLW